jgi:hypothetical protein
VVMFLISPELSLIIRVDLLVNKSIIIRGGKETGIIN